VRDRSGATTDQVLPDLQAPTFATYLAPVVAKDAVLVSDGRDAYGAFAHTEDILHIPIITSRGQHAYKGFHIQNVNAYASRLKDWLRPFKGVASWYLPSYLGWRRAVSAQQTTGHLALDGSRLRRRRLASPVGLRSMAAAPRSRQASSPWASR
jgi:hypothetical protein